MAYASVQMRPDDASEAASGEADSAEGIDHDATDTDEEWAGCLPAFGCYLCVIHLNECRDSSGAFTSPPAFLGRLAAAYLQVPTWPNFLVMSREAYWSICLDWRFVRHEPKDGVGLSPNCPWCTICGWLTRNLETGDTECEECYNSMICRQCASTKDGRRLCDICVQGTALRPEGDMQPQLSNLRSWRQNYAHENRQALDFLSRAGNFFSHRDFYFLPSIQRTRNDERVSDLRVFFRYWKNIAEGARDRRKHRLTQKEILAYYCPIWHRPRHGHGAAGRMRFASEARASGLFLQEATASGRQSRFSRPSWLSVRGKPVGIGWESTDATATPARGLRQ